MGTAPYHRFECKTTFGIRLKEGKNKVGNKAIWDSHLLQEFPVNKAVYTASSVACFWAGAVTRLYTLQRVLAVSLLIASSAEKTLLYYFGLFLLERDRPTDGQTDQPTDRPTDILTYWVVCTRLKSGISAVPNLGSKHSRRLTPFGYKEKAFKHYKSKLMRWIWSLWHFDYLMRCRFYYK